MPGEDVQPEHSTLLRAVTPVRMMWEFSTWMTRWPSLTRYAPIPMARQVTWAHTQGHGGLLGRPGCSTVCRYQENYSPWLCRGYTRSIVASCYSPQGDLKSKGEEQGRGRAHCCTMLMVTISS